MSGELTVKLSELSESEAVKDFICAWIESKNRREDVQQKIKQIPNQMMADMEVRLRADSMMGLILDVGHPIAGQYITRFAFPLDD